MAKGLKGGDASITDKRFDSRALQEAEQEPEAVEFGDIEKA